MASWFTSAIQSVRDKSIDALDFVRRDLTEFTTTVKSDTESYLNKIKSQDVGDLVLAIAPYRTSEQKWS
ncbi:unnamed protein product [Rotaria sordida]|uniref:Uncharacterized protein n=1 Tax=Rotaria sordida TaxID=392033 RepID=A0A815UFL4_9BILA|nr:unnamed protein product [Rotaria sordida]